MHLLFTNNTLDGLAGSELYIYEMALELQSRGHQITCFSLMPGQIAARLREKGITVATSVDELLALPPVDLIHAHHRLEARLAVACFPLVPVVYASLGPFHPLEQPGEDRGLFTRYIAISQDVKDKMVWVQQIPAEKISVVPNFVDLSRFTARRILAEKPQRVLLLTNHFKPIGIIEEACKLAGNLELKAIGAQTESVWNVEDYIDWADVVVTSAKGALQALAMGRAVVVYRPTGSDGLLTPANFQATLNYNFSGRAFARQLDAAAVAEEITGYTLTEVTELQQLVRSKFNLLQAADNLFQVYQQTIAEYQQQWSAASERMRYQMILAELSRYLVGFKEQDYLKAHFSFVLGDKGKASYELNTSQHEILQFLEATHAEVKERREYQLQLEVYTNQLEHRFKQLQHRFNETSSKIGVLEAHAYYAEQKLEQAIIRLYDLENKHQNLLLERNWLKQNLASVLNELQALKQTKSVRISQVVGKIWQKFKK